MIRFIVASVLLIAVPFSVDAQDKTATELNVASFSVRPDTLRNSPIIEGDVVLVIGTNNARHYRLDRRATDRKSSVKINSADSRTCPILLEQMAKVADLPIPSFVAPGSKREQGLQIIMHSTTYTLAMRGHESLSDTGAHMELSAPSGSPLAQWVDETLAALEPCWSDPVFDVLP